MLDVLFYLALICATVLTLGETLILLKTDKYWPLSLDDYAACLLLFYSAFTLDSALSQLLMLMAWCFMAGNLYAMLFTRMDPNGGSGERLPALALLLLVSLLGAGLSLNLVFSQLV